MDTITTDVLKQTFLIHNQQLSPKIQYQWQYPISSQVVNTYSRDVARSMLEFSYMVSVYNRLFGLRKDNSFQLNPPNFDIVIPLNILRMCNIAWFFYSTSLNIAVIVFTATYNDELLLVDLDYLQRDPTIIGNYTSGMKIHGGFWSFYGTIRPTILETVNKYINDKTQVLITGLSLGGATSTICTLDLYNRTLSNGNKISNLIHYSFASPRLFNLTGSQHYDYLKIPSYRIENGSDIITKVPLPIMISNTNPLTTESFLHVSTLKYFDMNLGDYYDNHILAYLKFFQVNPII